MRIVIYFTFLKKKYYIFKILLAWASAHLTSLTKNIIVIDISLTKSYFCLTLKFYFTILRDPDTSIKKLIHEPSAHPNPHT